MSAMQSDAFTQEACEQILRDAQIKLTPLDLAIRFHNIYERLAPDFGYETRTGTRDFNPETPNGKLMVAVCNEILRYHLGATQPKPESWQEIAEEAVQQAWDENLIDQNGKTPLRAIIRDTIERSHAAPKYEQDDK
jgi:hypothetical protein